MLTPAAIADLLREASRRAHASPAEMRLLAYRPRFMPTDRAEQGELTDAVLAVVETSGPVRMSDVAKRVGREQRGIANVLTRLVRDGRIERVRRGVYR